jgi:hypothetical protein
MSRKKMDEFTTSSDTIVAFSMERGLTTHSVGFSGPVAILKMLRFLKTSE